MDGDRLDVENVKYIDKHLRHHAYQLFQDVAGSWYWESSKHTENGHARKAGPFESRREALMDAEAWLEVSPSVR